MKTFKKLSAILACACVLGAGSVWAEDRAVENMSPMDAVQVNPEIMRAPVMFTTYGKLVAVEDGRYVVEGEGNLRVVAAAAVRAEGWPDCDGVLLRADDAQPSCAKPCAGYCYR